MVVCGMISSLPSNGINLVDRESFDENNPRNVSALINPLLDGKKSDCGVCPLPGVIVIIIFCDWNFNSIDFSVILLVVDFHTAVLQDILKGLNVGAAMGLSYKNRFFY